MVPTAIFVMVLAVWVRWWAVPMVAVGWAVLVGVGEPAVVRGAALLGAAHGAVGAAVGVAVRWAFRPSRRATSVT